MLWFKNIKTCEGCGHTFDFGVSGKQVINEMYASPKTIYFCRDCKPAWDRVASYADYFRDDVRCAEDGTPVGYVKAPPPEVPPLETLGYVAWGATDADA